MADRTEIEWTDATWNPIVGCSVVSSGCNNCYAMRLAGTRLKHHPSRAGLTRDTKTGPVWTGETRFDEKALLQPLRWRRPRKIFVCAHSDLFHETTPDAWIDRVFAIMALCPQHTFQVLTKRPERMRDYLSGDGPARVYGRIDGIPRGAVSAGWLAGGRPLPNVWLGVTAEDQRRADERIPILLEMPAAKRFVSVEPMLGAVDLTRLSCADPDEVAQYERGEIDGVGGHYIDALTGDAWDDVNGGLNAEIWDDLADCPPRLDWVICGGESGPGARPMHPDWVRSLRDQCAAVGVPFFFKQWGGFGPLAPGDGWWPSDSGNCIRLRVDGTRGPNGWPMQRVGKRAAGRLLDGVEHNGMPEVQS